MPEASHLPGQPLDSHTQTLMQHRFQRDFSDVRVHTGTAAAQSAASITALAYTTGPHIVFGDGQYAPHTPDGRHLLAHELAHVVQQGGGGDRPPRRITTSEAEVEADGAARAVEAGRPVTGLSRATERLARKAAPAVPNARRQEQRLARIDDLLSYGLFKWAITDSQALEALRLLQEMSPSELIAALPYVAVGRLIDNLPRPNQPELAVLLVAGAGSGVILKQLTRLLSSFLFDWFVSADDAVAAINLLEALPASNRDQIFDALGPTRRRRLWQKLPEADRARADRLWEEKQQRISERQLAAMQPAVAGPSEDPVDRRHREFRAFASDLPADDALVRYLDWIEKHTGDSEYLIITPQELYTRISTQVSESRAASAESYREVLAKGQGDVEASRRSHDKFLEFDNFFHARLKALDAMNATEADVQSQILVKFNSWIANNHHKPIFLKKTPMQVYEEIGHGVITLEVDRARMRAARAPQDDPARSKKLDEFLALAKRLNDYRRKFPYLIPVPGQHRDLLVQGDAMAVVFDIIAQDLRTWALEHMQDGDYTVISPTSVLATIVQKHDSELRTAQLVPLVFESIARTDLDPGIVATSFATTLGKILLGTLIVGIVVGAEILTAGQVTWIFLALAAAMGAKAYHDRREEIKQTGVEVPAVETVVHSAGDAVGLSQLIEGTTGVRLGTDARLDQERRSEELGEGLGSIAGLFMGSRAFETGRGTGAAWKATAPTVAGRIAPRALLPGPVEDFPFGSGRQPLPRPSSPNRVYRIMGLEEAAQALKSGRISGPAKGTMNSKFFSLDSKYAALFREKTLADVAQMGEGIAKAEINLASLERRIGELESRGDAARATELRGKATKLRADITSRVAENRALADPMIKDWYSAPGQKVVVEVELAPGTLEHVLNRAVEEPQIGAYQGKDVYIWKFERGYGQNIAVPSWQLENFNNMVRGIRFYAERGVELFGPREIPKGAN